MNAAPHKASGRPTNLQQVSTDRIIANCIKLGRMLLLASETRAAAERCEQTEMSKYVTCRRSGAASCLACTVPGQHGE